MFKQRHKQKTTTNITEFLMCEEQVCNGMIGHVNDKKHTGKSIRQA